MGRYLDLARGDAARAHAVSADGELARDATKATKATKAAQMPEALRPYCTLAAAFCLGLDVEQARNALEDRITNGQRYLGEHPDLAARWGPLLAELEAQLPAAQRRAELALRFYQLIRAIVLGFDVDDETANVSERLRVLMQEDHSIAQVVHDLAAMVPPPQMAQMAHADTTPQEVAA